MATEQLHRQMLATATLADSAKAIESTQWLPHRCANKALTARQFLYRGFHSFVASTVPRM